jgi:hypothetical protein
MTSDESLARSDGYAARLWTPGLRALAGGLVALAGGSLVALGLAGVFLDPRLLEPPLVFEILLIGAALPVLAAGWLGRSRAARVGVAGDRLTVTRAGRRLEVESAALAAAAPWRIPLPGPGLRLRARDLVLELELRDPAPLLLALAAGGDASARRALRHPVVVYARARAAARRPSRVRPALKFLLFPLLPGAILWNLHQYIAYGGTLGQYRLEGLGPALRSFAVHAASAAVYCGLFASVWRAAGEAVALAGAVAAPRTAAALRRAVEVAAALAYYVGIPALLLARIFAG